MITKTENSSFRDPSGFIFYRGESAIEKMHWRPRKSEWTNYYSESSHVPKFLEEKIKLFIS